MDTLLVLLSLASAFCLALGLVLTKFGLRALPPLAGAAISVPTAALLFLALTPVTVSLDAYDARGGAIFALAGAFFPIAVTLLTFSANRHLGPTMTGALGNLSPLFAVLLAILLLGEAPRTAQAAGMAIVIIGVVLIALARGRGPTLAIGAFPAWALLLPLAAAFVRGVVQPLVKLGLAYWPDPFAAATIGYCVSAVAALVVWRVFGRRDIRMSWRGAIFAGVGLANGTALLTLYAALERGPVAVVAPLVATYPLAALLIERVFPDRPRLAMATILGVAITVGGVGLLLAG